MQQFNTLASRVIPLPMKDVDTDMIIPAQHLTQTSREGYGKFLFEHLKNADAAFVLNQVDYQDAKILLTRSNFGCGSSREHAVWALQQAGIAVIIAESFSDIFFNNAAKNGLLLISLPPQVIDRLLKRTEQQPLVLEVNLAQQTIRGESIEQHFAYDAFRKDCLLNGYDDMDYLLKTLEAIGHA